MPRKLYILLSLLLLVSLGAFWLWLGEDSPLRSRRARGGSPQEVMRAAYEKRGTIAPGGKGKRASASEDVAAQEDESSEDDEARYLVTATSAEQVAKLQAALRAARIAFRYDPRLRTFQFSEHSDALARLLSGEDFADLNVEDNLSTYLLLPQPEEPEITGIPVGHRLRRLVGAEGEERGSGVKIAVLDTFVDVARAELPSNVTVLNPFKLGTDGEAADHGSAVVSMITGAGDIDGIADQASVTAYTVLDGNGYGTALNVAKAIVQAVDDGANLINLSLGFSYSSSTLQAAIEYAQANGVVVVAAAGNSGEKTHSTVCYPAAYEGVIAVGAVDAMGERASFSSTGPELVIMAPGVGNATRFDDETLLFSGTSAAAPAATAVIAYTMSQMENLNAVEVASVVLANADDNGTPGKDEQYGLGVVDAERAVDSETPGIYLVAPTGVTRTTLPDGTAAYAISAQNQGTEPLESIELHATITYQRDDGTTASSTWDLTFSNVAPGQTVSGIANPTIPAGTPVTFTTTVSSPQMFYPPHRKTTRLVVGE
ncbi:MAG: S8 family serine peptidase [Victivallales bacterium]|nr:S8 family serine peptidase [Victivallales bacterium]